MMHKSVDYYFHILDQDYPNLKIRFLSRPSLQLTTNYIYMHNDKKKRLKISARLGCVYSTNSNKKRKQQRGFVATKKREVLHVHMHAD